MRREPKSLNVEGRVEWLRVRGAGEEDENEEDDQSQHDTSLSQCLTRVANFWGRELEIITTENEGGGDETIKLVSNVRFRRSTASD